MSRHIPLYKSALRLVQVFVLEAKLRVLVENCNIFDLVKNMKQFVDTYIQKIKLTDEDEGLASMVPILNSTYDTVNSHLKPPLNTNALSSSETSGSAAQDVERTYCDLIKHYQFDSFPIITENANGTFKVKKLTKIKNMDISDLSGFLVRIFVGQDFSVRQRTGILAINR